MDINDLTVNELRDQGYAVVVFSLDELSGASPGIVEESMTETGWITIDIWKD